MASNLPLIILLLAHSISDPMRSHTAKRLNLGLYKLFKVLNPDNLMSIKALLALRTASKLHGTALSQKWWGQVAKMVKRGLRLFWRLEWYLIVKYFFLDETFHWKLTFQLKTLIDLIISLCFNIIWVSIENEFNR